MAPWLLTLVIAAAPVDRPLGLDIPSAFRALVLAEPLQDARPPEQPELELRWTVANDWSVPTLLERGARQVVLRDDAQLDRWSASLRWRWARTGFGARLSTSVELSARELWGGWTDAPIEAWHRAVGFGNFDREKYRRNAVVLILAEPGGRSAVDLQRSTFALGDAVLRQHLLLLARGTLTVGARVDLSLPIGDPSRLGGAGSPGVGAALVSRWAPAAWLTVHAQLALARAPRLSDRFPLQLRLLHATTAMGAVLHRGPWALLAEDTLASPLFESGWAPVVARPDDALDTAAFGGLRWCNQLSFGLRRGAFTVWLSEDFTPGHVETTGASWFYDTNAPDLVLGLGARW